MYNAHIRFYMISRTPEMFELIKKMTAPESFTYEFTESDKVESALAAAANVIFADVRGGDANKELKTLVSARVGKNKIIVIADKEQTDIVAEYFSEIDDLWTGPLSEKELEFRFRRWQDNIKMLADFWQTSQYLEATINGIPNLIWYKDKDGVHEKVNDSFCRTVNKTKDDVQGKRHAYIWDVEEDDPACIESENRVMSEEITLVSEETIMTGEGTRLLTTYKSPLYDFDGSVMGTVGVAIDVTKERAYEQELLMQNHTLETIFTAMDCGVMRHTLDGSKILNINAAALKILGYKSREELMEKGFNMIAPSVVDADKEKLRERIKTLENPGDIVSVEYSVQHDDGEIIHVMGSVKLLEENGQRLYQRFLFDSTEHKLEEEKNDRRQMELVHALGIDYNLICVFDLDTGKGNAVRIGECRKGLLDSLFSDELSAKNIENYIDTCVYEDDRDMLRRAICFERLKSELAEKKTYYVNYRTFCENSIRYFQVKAVRAGLWEEDHSIVIGFRSVDEETRGEMEKKSVLEEALQQANKANKAKTAFLSNMSHDIRTPMNAIIGFTTLAINHIDKKEQVEAYLRKIMTSGSHLLGLINDILDMSHIESGKIHLDEKPCRMPEILHGLKSIVQADADAKQLKLNIDASGVLDETIYCDKLRLNQVLLNLMSNAIKYTDAGGRINLKVTEKDGAPAGYANYEFVIKDTGIGISREFIKHIFEPFERERNSTISGIQGTGLGMAITKSIVDMMNGRIKVESEVGVGTEVTVLLTFRIHTDESIPEAESSVRDRKTLRTGRILLTEDNELNQEIAEEILTEAGFTVEIAGNGRIAVDMLENSDPDYYQLVLMDIQMPIMDGYEATKAIRKLEDKRLSTIPIVAMTANAFEEDKQAALRYGMNAHITKPIDIDVLLETLDKMMR